MTVEEALHEVTHLYVETAPFIYYLEENPTYIDRMDQVIEHIKRVPIRGICSVVTLTEVLPIPLKVGNTALVRAYREILLNSREFECLSLDRKIALRAAELRARYTLKTPDALHLASALEAGCDAFLTNDKDLKRVGELRVVLLDDLETDPKG